MPYLASGRAERAHVGHTYVCVCVYACCCGACWGGLVLF